MRVLNKSIWPFRVIINKPSNELNITEMEIWLGRQFKTYHKRWYIIHGSSQTEFYFQTEKDSNWFVLRWQ